MRGLSGGVHPSGDQHGDHTQIPSGIASQPHVAPTSGPSRKLRPLLPFPPFHSYLHWTEPGEGGAGGRGVQCLRSLATRPSSTLPPLPLHAPQVPYFSLPSNDLNDVIAPSCYSCFDYPNYLADMTVGYMGVPPESGVEMTEHLQVRGGRWASAWRTAGLSSWRPGRRPVPGGGADTWACS